MSEADGTRKKRKCLSAACERCRAKKIGCDVHYPCGHCVTAGADCVFGQQRKRGRQRAGAHSSQEIVSISRRSAGVPLISETVNLREDGLVGDYLHDYYVQAFMDYVEPLEPLWERDKATHGAMRLSWLRRDEHNLTDTQRFQKAAALAFVARSCLHNAVADQFLAEARTDLGQAIDDFSTCTATGLCFLATTHWGTDWERYYHYLRVARSVLSGLPRTQRAAMGQFTCYGLRDYTAGIRKLSNIFHKFTAPMDSALDALVTRRDHLRTLFLSRQLCHAPVIIKVVVQFCEGSTMMDLLAHRIYCLARYPNLTELNPPDRPFLDENGAVALLKGAEQLEALVTQENRLAFGHATDTILLNVVMLRLICYWPRRMFGEADAAAWSIVAILGRITSRTFYMPFLVMPAVCWLSAYAVDQRRVEIAQAIARFLEPLRVGVPTAQDIVTVLNGELLQPGSVSSSTLSAVSMSPSPMDLQYSEDNVAAAAAALLRPTLAHTTTTTSTTTTTTSDIHSRGPSWFDSPAGAASSAPCRLPALVAKTEGTDPPPCEFADAGVDASTPPSATLPHEPGTPLAVPVVNPSERTSDLARHFVEAALANTRAVNLVVKILEPDSPLIHGRVQPHAARGSSSDSGTESTTLVHSPVYFSPGLLTAPVATPALGKPAGLGDCEYEPWPPEVSSFMSALGGDLEAELFNLTDVGCR